MGLLKSCGHCGIKVGGVFLQCMTLQWHALESCLDSLIENDPRFIDARWDWFKRKEAPKIAPKISRPRHKIHDLEPVFDHALLLATTLGRLMLQNKQKMAELVSACTALNLKMDMDGNILMAINPTTKNNFSVFWYSFGECYIYTDVNGYCKFSSTAAILNHIRTKNKGNMVPKDTFFWERFNSIIELNRIMPLKLKSRLEILEYFLKYIKTMALCGFRMNTDKQNNPYAPCEGTRKTKDSITNVFYLFYDTQYNYFEYDAKHNLQKQLNSSTIHGLLNKMLAYSQVIA